MLIAAVTGLAHAEKLSIDEGTFEFGGSATANIVIADGVNNVFLQLAPSGGYFVADRVELLAGVEMTVDEGTFDIGFFGGFDFFFTGDGVAPYLGATVGYGVARFDEAPLVVQTTDSVTLSGRGGFVLPLNKKVGMDLGARLNLNVYNGDTLLHIPMGYVGVRAFFP
jgi:hypothetical protein